MSRNTKLLFVLVLTLSMFSACRSVEKLVDPFVGNWVSGAFNLEFNKDRTFELSICNTISVNLEGEYEYDDGALTLYIDGESKLLFRYKFKDDKNTLFLKPDGDSSYIKTKIEFKRE